MQVNNRYCDSMYNCSMPELGGDNIALYFRLLCSIIRDIRSVSASARLN